MRQSSLPRATSQNLSTLGERAPTVRMCCHSTQPSWPCARLLMRRLPPFAAAGAASLPLTCDLCCLVMPLLAPAATFFLVPPLAAATFSVLLSPPPLQASLLPPLPPPRFRSMQAACAQPPRPCSPSLFAMLVPSSMASPLRGTDVQRGT